MKKVSKTNKYRDYAILVLSCDKYADLWNSFFLQFDKFWPNCPFEIYLGSNSKAKSRKNVTALNSNTNIDWSTDLLSILNQIKQQYIFIWLEDLFLIDKVNEKEFIEVFKFMKVSNANHIHIEPAIKPDLVIGKFGEYNRKAPYRVSAIGFWNVQTLKELLVMGENAWNFEIMGSYRSSYKDGYYTVMNRIFKYLHVVSKGHIINDAYQYCIENKIPLDLSKRSVHQGQKKLIYNIQTVVFHIMLRIPWKLRVNMLNFFRKFFISY